MPTITEKAEHCNGNIHKKSETFPTSIPVGPRIEELELEGWTFVNSNTQHGFTTLYFSQFED